MKIETVGDYTCKALHVDDEGLFMGIINTHPD